VTKRVFKMHRFWTSASSWRDKPRPTCCAALLPHECPQTFCSSPLLLTPPLPSSAPFSLYHTPIESRKKNFPHVSCGKKAKKKHKSLHLGRTFSTPILQSSSHTPELCGMAELNLHRWWRECVSIPIGISCTGCCNIESQRGKQAAPDRRAAVALTRRVGTTTRAPKVGPGLDAMQPAPQVAEREKREQ